MIAHIPALLSIASLFFAGGASASPTPGTISSSLHKLGVKGSPLAKPISLHLVPRQSTTSSSSGTSTCSADASCSSAADGLNSCSSATTATSYLSCFCSSYAQSLLNCYDAGCVNSDASVKATTEYVLEACYAYGNGYTSIASDCLVSTDPNSTACQQAANSGTATDSTGTDTSGTSTTDSGSTDTSTGTGTSTDNTDSSSDSSTTASDSTPTGNAFGNGAISSQQANLATLVALFGVGAAAMATL